MLNEKLYVRLNIMSKKGFINDRLRCVSREFNDAINNMKWKESILLIHSLYLKILSCYKLTHSLYLKILSD